MDDKHYRCYGEIDKFQRVQKCLLLEDIFPTKSGICCCGCLTPLKGKQRRWASQECNSYAMSIFGVIAGNSGVIRTQLWLRDKGFCQMCGLECDYSPDTGVSEWHADHIIPVHKGGGGTGLWNFQTLCIPCHKIKTLKDR